MDYGPHRSFNGIAGQREMKDNARKMMRATLRDKGIGNIHEVMA
jgi:hypothetical protein